MSSTEWDQTGSFSLFIIQVNLLYSNILRIGKAELNLCVSACTHPLPCFPIWDMDSEKGFFRMIRWANFLDVRKSPIGSDLCLFRRPYWSSAAPTTARNSRLPRSNMDSAPKPLIPQSLPVAAQTWWADLKAGCFWSKSPSVPSETCGQTDPWDPLCLVYSNLSSPCYCIPERDLCLRLEPALYIRSGWTM